MRTRDMAALAATAFGLFVSAGSASAQSLTTVRAASGLVRPIYVTHAPGDFHRIFVIEKQGRIRVVKDGVLLATSFLDIDSIVGGGTSASSEQGLLGLTFHPDYAKNGYFYVNYTNLSGDTVVARYSVSADPDIADAGTPQRVLFVDQPYSNHNGGWTEFGPDGYLYVALGDGGDGCDTGERAQNLEQLLGKMLRIDINADDFPGDPDVNYAIPPDNPFVDKDGRDEIWAWGLRNPWRDSFDAATGDLYIADVGQGEWEEINFQPASSAGGVNYGWDCKEGMVDSTVSGCTTRDCTHEATFTYPVHVYSHDDGCSITGGYVYRGCAIAGLGGTYFFADYCSTKIWSFKYVDGVGVTEFVERTSELDPAGAETIGAVTSFGTDAYGEIYICDQADGVVYKIVSRDPASPDCNANGKADACDILDGTSLDADGDGVPDECVACRPDCNKDGKLNINDFICFQSEWARHTAYGDYNGDGVWNVNDFLVYRQDFVEGCG